ncbi:MAG TPA: TonB-dependent receptor [Bacteroidales bacterium]|nr:TonB-dependent receptor [Bacteroidales bacterium]
MKNLYIFLILILIPAICSGQANQYALKGKITDEHGSPLSGASITIDGTLMGVISDSNGDYVFPSLDEGIYKVSVSFIGFESSSGEVTVNKLTILDFSLQPAIIRTGEVFVRATRASERTPLAYSTINRENLKKINTAQDIPYMLSLTPSMVETSEAGNGVGYTSLRIRGTDANRINVTIDGIPLNDPESHQVFWVDLPDLASSVENIQVQRGVGTSTNGAGAFGATVSIQTVVPETTPFAEINSSAGSFNTFKNVISAGTGMLGGKFGFNMRYSDIRSNGFIDRTGSKHRSAFMTGLYRSGRSSLKANIILGEEHTGIGWWGVPADSLNTNRRYNPAGQYTDETGKIKYYDNESDNYNQDHYQLIYSFSPSNSLNMNAALHYTRGVGYYEEYREDQHFSEYGISPFVIGGDLIESSDLIRRKWLDNNFFGAVYSLNYTAARAAITAGGGMNRYLGDHYGTIIWMQNAGNYPKDFRWYFNQSDKSDFNIYAKVLYDLSSHLKIFGDIQYRFINYSMDGADDDLKDLTQKHKFNFLNPKAGLFYEINQNQDAWVSLSVANREPTRNDYKEASGDPGATPGPERLYDAEAGYKLRKEKLSLSVNLYGMFYEDQLVPTGELSDVGYSIMTNVDRSHRIGIELSSALNLTRWLTWNSNFTFSRNKIMNFTEFYTDYNTSDWSSQYLSKDLGKVDIAYSPSQVWTSDLAVSKNWFGVHLISKFVGKQYFDNTMHQERSIKPYFVNSLRVDVTPAISHMKGMELQLLVNNLFNEAYESNAYGGNWYEDGAEKTWSYFFPQAGINFMFRLGLKF